MFHNLTNTLKDLLGINKVVLFRTFSEWNWSKPQPMFNVLQVEPGEEQLFEKFLNRAQEVSSKIGSPVSLGPYITDKKGVYIYVTHYGSTGKFIRVMGALLVKGVSAMRSKATQSTSWTYCHFEGSESLPSLDSVYILGIKGDVDPLNQFLHQKGVSIASKNRMIFNARGEAWGSYYYVFAATPENYQRIQEFASRGGALVLYQGKKLKKSPV